MVDLKESQVHTFVCGRKIVGSDKGKGVLDIFTAGKEVLEHGAFRDWKNRTGKLGADVFGCDTEYQHQQGEAVGDRGLDGDEGVAGGEKEAPVEFDAQVDLEMENEI